MPFCFRCNKQYTTLFCVCGFGKPPSPDTVIHVLIPRSKKRKLVLVDSSQEEFAEDGKRPIPYAPDDGRSAAMASTQNTQKSPNSSLGLMDDDNAMRVEPSPVLGDSGGSSSNSGGNSSLSANLVPWFVPSSLFEPPPPRLLSSTDSSNALALRPAFPTTLPCQNKTNTDKDKQKDEKKEPPLDPIALRVLYWNIERLGDDTFPGTVRHRSQDAIDGLADVIHLCDPHLVVLVEVMALNGCAEVNRLIQALTLLGNAWALAMPDGFTGRDLVNDNSGTHIADTGESYAVLYRTGIGINFISARFGQRFDGEPFNAGQFEGRDGPREYRKPAEFFFKMGGQFQCKGAGPWNLPIVAFHAPAPNGMTQEKIEELIAELGNLASVRDKKLYPDCLICGDFNSNQDAYNISPEPENFLAVEEFGWEDEETQEYVSLHTWHQQEVERRLANARERADDEDYEPNKAALKKIIKKSDDAAVKLFAEKKQEQIHGLIGEHNLWHLSGGRARALVQQMKAITALIEEIRELDADDEVDRSEYLTQQEALLEQLKGLNPGIAGIHHIEHMSHAVEALRRAKGWYKKLEAELRRQLAGMRREGAGMDKMAGREDAYEALNELGFFSNLDYDEDLLTTRRRNISALKEKGVRGKLRMPDHGQELQFSKYDQILARTEGQLYGVDNCVLPMLAAVLNADAANSLFAAGGDEGGDDGGDDESSSSSGTDDDNLYDSGGDVDMGGTGNGSEDNEKDSEKDSEGDDEEGSENGAEESSSSDDSEEQAGELMELPMVDAESPLATVDFDNLPGLASHRFQDANLRQRLNVKSWEVLDKHLEKDRILDEDREKLPDRPDSQASEDSESSEDESDDSEPNFHSLQIGLMLARKLSDHEPMLIGFWVDRERTPHAPAREKSSANKSKSSSKAAHDPDPPPVRTTFLMELLAHEGKCWKGVNVDVHSGLLWQQLHFHIWTKLWKDHRQTPSDQVPVIIQNYIDPLYALVTSAIARTGPSAPIGKPGGVVNVINFCYVAAVLHALAAVPFYYGELCKVVAMETRQRASLRSILFMATTYINKSLLVTGDMGMLVRTALNACGWNGGTDQQDAQRLWDFINTELQFDYTSRTQKQMTYTKPGQPTRGGPSPVTNGWMEQLAMRRNVAQFTFAECLHDTCNDSSDDAAGWHSVSVMSMEFKKVAALMACRFTPHTKSPTRITGMSTFRLGNVDHARTVVICHKGDQANQGHYIAYVSRNGKIYRCDDSTVTEHHDQPLYVDLNREDEYLSFYHLPDPPLGTWWVMPPP